MDDTSTTLCVDLDGTLVRSDLLVESALAAFKARPISALKAFLSLVRGRAQMKQRLAEQVDLRIDLLPYNPAVIALAEKARASGRSVALATASNRKYAEQVAGHLGLFDAIFASDGETNLSSQTKAECLEQSYGEGRFDYVGDSRKDLAVWSKARRAFVVNPQAGVIAGLQGRSIPYECLTLRGPDVATVLRALRPHQWLKNALVFVPLLGAHLYFDPAAILSAAMAFVAFSVMASAGYLINDLLDLDSDRQHSRKRQRPLASGALPLVWGLALIPILIGAGAVLGALLSPLFVGVLFGYLAATLAYSLHLKRRPTVDVLTLATLYTVRVIGGAAAIGVGLSFWLLAFSVFLFLSLAYLKRYAELEALRSDGGDWASGRGYGVKDLELVRSLGIPAGYGAVMVLALYINSPEVRVLYAYPELIWLVCPLLLYWIARAWTIAHRGLMHDDPLVFAIEDRGSQVTVLSCALVMWLAL